MSSSPSHEEPAPVDIPAGACCLGCGYALRGLTVNRCPECGRVFHPADPRTMKIGTGIPQNLKKFLALPGRWFHLVVAAAALMSILMSAIPGWSFGFEILIGFGWIGVCIIWAVRVVLALGIALAYKYRLLAEPGAVRKIVTAPAVLLIAFVLVISELPRMATFVASRPAFERVATGALRGDAGACDPQWIGLFRIERVEVGNGVVHFEWGGGFMVREGFAFSQTPLPARIGADYYGHFFGDWYTWWQDW